MNAKERLLGARMTQPTTLYHHRRRRRRRFFRFRTYPALTMINIDRKNYLLENGGKFTLNYCIGHFIELIFNLFTPFYCPCSMYIFSYAILVVHTNRWL